MLNIFTSLLASNAPLGVQQVAEPVATACVLPVPTALYSCTSGGSKHKVWLLRSREPLYASHILENQIFIAIDDATQKKIPPFLQVVQRSSEIPAVSTNRVATLSYLSILGG